MLNVISVDVEEYFQATNISSVVGPPERHGLASRVEYSTKIVLDLFARTAAKGTFFVLGQVARRFPDLIRDISAAGHEVASHGYGHKLAYEQSPKQFLSDVYRARLLLEDLCGRQVFGYRAPNFSIKTENDWAYDLLIRAGYRYDSSRYPVWHPRYANHDKSMQPCCLERADGRIYVFPLAAGRLRILGKELRYPLAGGAYWRLFPEWYFRLGFRRLQKCEPGWFSCYVHPWEFDPGQPKVPGLPFSSRLRHYTGLARLERTTERFLRLYSFAPFCEAGKQVFGADFLVEKDEDRTGKRA